MESNGKFTLIVFNTCTQEYEEVIVTEEVYRTYCRTRWNIKWSMMQMPCWTK